MSILHASAYSSERKNLPAILFESAIWAKLPEEIDEKLALAVLDVAGAPAQTAKLVEPGDKVLIIGAAGKSGMLCGYEAKKIVGEKGKVIGVTRENDGVDDMENSGFFDEIIQVSARDAVALMNEVEKRTLIIGGKVITDDFSVGEDITIKEKSSVPAGLEIRIELKDGRIIKGVTVE